MCAGSGGGAAAGLRRGRVGGGQRGRCRRPPRQVGGGPAGPRWRWPGRRQRCGRQHSGAQGAGRRAGGERGDGAAAAAPAGADPRYLPRGWRRRRQGGRCARRASVSSGGRIRTALARRWNELCAVTMRVPDKSRSFERLVYPSVTDVGKCLVW